MSVTVYIPTPFRRMTGNRAEVKVDAENIAELLDNLGNIALLQRCESVGLLPAGVGVGAANAYRELRRVQHKARLDEQSTALDAEAAAPLVAHRQAVKALWLAVFG